MSLKWIFDAPLASGSKKGGLANAQVFPSDIDSFVREVLQNARDQRLPESSDGVGVRFELAELSGQEFDDFLSAIEWTELREHVRASAINDYPTIGPRLQAGIRAVEEYRTLRVLLIEDVGTRGLTGDENDDSSNFNALCRNELITSSDRRESGGSFGLGKSVLWRFSELSTVLFASELSDSGETRFFGRTLLPWHTAGERDWDGSGWFGAPDPDPDRERAVSLFGDAAGAAAASCGLGRPAGQTGTSILVVGFDDPDHEEEPDIKTICEEIVASSARWLWPALLRGDMRVLVEGRSGDEKVFAQHVHVHAPEVMPFVFAQTEIPDVEGTLDTPGDVVIREFTVPVPEQRAEAVDNPREAVDAPVVLRVRLAESGEDDFKNTVAMQRGAGMVVRHEPIRQRGGGDGALHGVLLAGLARGDSAADLALEEFLRAAEPPAHSAWVHNTDRVKAEYQTPIKKCLDALFGGIDDAIRELTREEVSDSDDGPDALKRLFPLPGVGGGQRPPLPSYQLTESSASLDEAAWKFSGQFARKIVDEGEPEPWKFTVSLYLDQEGAGSGSARGDRLAIETLSADRGAESCGPSNVGTYEVAVPAGVDHVRFEGRSLPADGFAADKLSRVRLRMDVRYEKPTGGNL